MTIYFIQASISKHIKIGFTDGRPHDRLDCLQTGNHERLELIATIQGDETLERQLHQQFKALRGVGEWFAFEEPLISFIDRGCRIDVPTKYRDTTVPAYWARSEIARAWLESTGWVVRTRRATRNGVDIPAPQYSLFYYDLHDVSCETDVRIDVIVEEIRRFAKDEKAAGSGRQQPVDVTDHEA